ncbi:MAG TPA: M56 family metallopeptidase [Steroidobacteraceae bacterium]|nr:M56 family metallopeptidase [Steroidobacteraceae bacterium]
MIALILEAAARSTLLIALVALALALARPGNPHLHKLLWTTVAAASLLMPALLAVHVTPAIHAPVRPLTVLAAAAAPPGHAWVRSGIELAYLATALGLLGRYGVGWMRLWRTCRNAQACREPWASGLDVRVSSRIGGPATFGTTILLPSGSSGWSEPQRDAVLAHERAHVRNRDCWVLWLARLNAACFWFNPLSWWLTRRLSALAEQTSDDAAVVALGDRAGYAEILLALGAGRASPLAAAMARPRLSSRIERVLSGAAPAAALKRSQRLLALVLIAPAVALAAAPVELAALTGASAPSPHSYVHVADPTQPHVVSFGRIGAFYPKRAKRKGIEGTVDVAVTLDAAGRPLNARVVSEAPAGHGFGAAAAAAAVQEISYSNPTGHRATLVFRVQFALKTAGAHPG